MKKLGLLAVAALATIAFPACSNTDGDYPNYMDFVTVRMVNNTTDAGGTSRTGSTDDAKDFYFVTDSETTIYPTDKSRIVTFEPKDGERAVITFNFLPDIEDYNYSIKLYAIRSIFTSTAHAISTQTELDALKDNPILVTGALLTDNYLTISTQYPVNDNSKHKFKLIINDVKQTTTKEGYLDMELYHDAGGELEGGLAPYYVSFNLADIESRLSGMKGITLRMKGASEIHRDQINFRKK